MTAQQSHALVPPPIGRMLAPLFSGSGAVWSMDLCEDEPNDDYESFAMRQRMQQHGGQLMTTTQVTTKVPPGLDGGDPHSEIALKARPLFSRDCLTERN